MNPFKRKLGVYESERKRLLKELQFQDPTSDEYHTVMNRLDQLDKILNRTSELKKTLIPTLATGIGVGAIYSLQQFGGVLIPKALDAIASRQQQRNHSEQ